MAPQGTNTGLPATPVVTKHNLLPPPDMWGEDCRAARVGLWGPAFGAPRHGCLDKHTPG